MTLALALRPHHAPPPPPRPTIVATEIAAAHVTGCDSLQNPLFERRACESAHALVVRGHITGGASHVQLAGPILYTDVTTNAAGEFELRVPVDGNVCDLLPEPKHFAFDGDGMTVRYDISFDR